MVNDNGEIERQEIFIAQIRLVQAGWKVAAQLKVTLRPEKLSRQEQWISADNSKLSKLIKDWENTFGANSSTLPEPAFDKMPIR